MENLFVKPDNKMRATKQIIVSGAWIATKRGTQMGVKDVEELYQFTPMAIYKTFFDCN
jgi:hypothetical protein